VKGRKRHLLVDTEGLVITVQVTSAGVQDHHQVYALVASGKHRSQRLTKVWVDEGYQGKEVAEAIRQDLQVDLEIVPKPVGQKGFVLVPRRWVVERTFAWLGRYRRLSKDYEYWVETSQSMIYLAMSHLMLRRLAKPRRPDGLFQHPLRGVSLGHTPRQPSHSALSQSPLRESGDPIRQRGYGAFGRWWKHYKRRVQRENHRPVFSSRRVNIPLASDPTHWCFR
jgi:transposase